LQSFVGIHPFRCIPSVDSLRVTFVSLILRIDSVAQSRPMPRLCSCRCHPHCSLGIFPRCCLGIPPILVSITSLRLLFSNPPLLVRRSVHLRVLSDDSLSAITANHPVSDRAVFRSVRDIGKKPTLFLAHLQTQVHPHSSSSGFFLERGFLFRCTLLLSALPPPLPTG